MPKNTDKVEAAPEPVLHLLTTVDKDLMCILTDAERLDYSARFSRDAVRALELKDEKLAITADIKRLEADVTRLAGIIHNGQEEREVSCKVMLREDGQAEVIRTDTGATTEVRAMYGGLQAAIGCLTLGGLLRASLVRPALLTVAFLTTGLASTRLAGVLIDGSFSSYTAGGLGFEIVSALAALLLLRRTGGAQQQPSAA